MVNLEVVTLVLLLLYSCSGLQVPQQRRDAKDDQDPSKTILEMLHIERVSASHQQAQPHPYMKRIYQSLHSMDFGGVDGTLVQSFRSIPSKFDCFF